MQLVAIVFAGVLFVVLGAYYGLVVRPERALIERLAPRRTPRAKVFRDLLRIRDRLVPHHTAGLRVQRDDVGVGGACVHFVTVDRDRSLDARLRARRQTPRVLPEQITRRGVHRLDLVAVRVYEQHAVVKERCAFVRTVRQRPTPGGAQSADVRLVDLRQRAESLAVVASPPGGPFAGGGILQHRVSDRRVLVQRVQTARARGQRRERRQAAARSARRSGQQHRFELIDLGRQRFAIRCELILRHQVREEAHVLLEAQRSGRRRPGEGQPVEAEDVVKRGAIERRAVRRSVFEHVQSPTVHSA